MPTYRNGATASPYAFPNRLPTKPVLPKAGQFVGGYQDLNSAKFKVIHEIDRQLPVRPYDAEWESVERGENPALYLPFTHVERVVPWLSWRYMRSWQHRVSHGLRFTHAARWWLGMQPRTAGEP